MGIGVGWQHGLLGGGVGGGSAQSSPAQWGTGGSRDIPGGGGVRGKFMLLPYPTPHMNKVQVCVEDGLTPKGCSCGRADGARRRARQSRPKIHTTNRKT